MMFSNDQTPSSGLGSKAVFPLTEAQEGLWYAQRLDPLNPIFNTAHCTDFRGQVDIPLLCKAINQTLVEADALSLRMVETADGPQQFFDPAHQPVVELVDLRHLGSQAEAHAAAAMHAEHMTPLDPSQAPLALHRLYWLSDTHCQWYQRVHHLAADGYGMSLIEARATQLYESECQHTANTTKALTSFSEVVRDDQQYRQSDARERSQAFWLKHLASLENVASLSADSALTDHVCLQAHAPVDAATLKRLLTAQKHYECSWPDILTALSAAYIQRHTDQPDVVVGMPWMGRMGNISARAVATVMNIAPLVLAIDQRDTVEAFVKASAKHIQTARRHGRYRSEQLRRDLGLLGGMRRLHGPLINILPFDAPYTMQGIQAKQQVLCAGPVEDLNINFRSAPDASGLRLEIEANPKLYTQDEVDAHLTRFLYFLHQALGSVRLSSVPSLTPAEHRRWVRDVNQTDHPISTCSLPKLVAQQCERTPDAIALRFKEQSTTYQQFSETTQNIARHLVAAGVGRGDIVAVALPRSDAMVMCLHGIMAAGAAYLPLDLAQPSERSLRILKAASPKALIIDDAAFNYVPDTVKPLNLATLFEEADAVALPSATPLDPAYVLYTSGSTGDPKGVVVSHRAIVNRLQWMKAHYQLDESARFLQKTPYTFDVSLWELFLPMLCGAPLTVAEPEQHKDPYALAQLIRDQHISVVHFVPSMLNAFLDEPLSQGLHIDYVFCSGEALSLPLCQRFYRQMSGQLHNLYGPTEAAVDVSYWPILPNDIADPVPIGKPVWNTQLYILDDLLRPVPPGVPGTLYIGGLQLAEGYLGRTDLTAQQFIHSPFSTDPDSRLYNTGDLARWREDGAIVYLGRADHQIKLRGQRIELGEIESCLVRQPNVHHAAVIAREDQPGQPYIAAYLVAKSAVDADSTDAVLAHARLHLPEAMVPTAVVWLDALPINANGKLDRKALPAPQRESSSGKALQGSLQHEVAARYQALLQLEKLPFANDDFFALGGHSLLAAQLIGQLRESTGLALSLGAIFENPSVERFAAYLERMTRSNTSVDTTGFDTVLRLREAQTDESALFCIHPAGGLSWCYGLLARELEGQRAVYGLQSSSLHAERAHPQNLHEMAQHYADAIQALQPTGPYHLLGWSVGGIIVHEVAHVLAERGQRLGVLAMLDAYPCDAWRDQAAPEAANVYKALLYIAGYDPDSLPDLTLSEAGVIDFLRANAHPLGELSTAQLQGVFRSVELNNRLVREHFHHFLNHDVLYFRAALDHQNDTLTPEMWAPWVNALQLHQVPSLHAHLTGPHAMEHIVSALNSALRAASTLQQEAECNSSAL